MSGTREQPPAAAPRPHREVVGGIAYDDPWAWLEEESEETLAWQRAHDAAAVAELHGWAGFEPLADALEQELVDGGMEAPRPAGGRWFHVRPSAAGTRLTVSDDVRGGGERVLLDTAALDDPRGPASLDWHWPAPDGGHVAFGLSFGGDEQSVLHVVEVATGRVLEDRIPFCSNATVAWLPDGRSFYYNGGLAPDFEDAEKHLFLHRLGDRERSAPEPVEVRDPYCVFPQVSPDGRHLAAITSELDLRPDFVRELPDGEWRAFLEGFHGTGFGFFDGGDYVCVSTFGAPRGRLVRIPVATPRAPATWVELVAESPDVVLKTVARAGDRIVLTQYRDTYAEVRVLERDGHPVADVELPGRGAVLQRMCGFFQEPPPQVGENVFAAPGEFTFVFSTLTCSPALYRYEIGARRLERLTAPRRTGSELVVEDLEGRAQDGAPVRYRLVRRRDADPALPRPTVVYVYGGWNISTIPAYMGAFATVVDAGGVFVLAHLRGGGEFGDGFWHDGRLADKQRTFDDTYAVAESLIAEGRTEPELLALVGGSNGGLGTGVALTQRPELFGAVASLVPLYDMLKFDRDPYTASCVVEYGDPREPADARWLHAYSPVHNVREAAYPATLIVAGANDMRCWPWHARKLAAALLAANRGGRPILLRVSEQGGHVSVRKQAAEWLGFAMRELGLAPAPAAPPSGPKESP